jgi:hypothetical protein
VIKILKDDYSSRLLCETLGVHRCNLDHEPRPDEDRPIKEALRELAGDTDREIGASFDRSDGATWGGRRSWRLLF